jgi:MFS family permease
MIPLALIPFFLIQLPLGRLADKRHDEREFLVIGFALLALATMLLSFITSENFILWAGLIALGRVGAAIVQIMTETYFYKQIDASNVNLISMFRSLRPVGTICAPLVATIALLFIASYQYLFLILGIIILIGIPVSRSLEQDNFRFRNLTAFLLC